MRMKKVMKDFYNIPAMLYNKIFLKLHHAECGSITINGRLRVWGKGKLCIGSGTRINSRFRNNPIGGQTYTSFYMQPGAVIKIGENSGISNSSFYAANSIIIGSHVKIGGDVRMLDTDFHSLSYIERQKTKEASVKTAPIIVEDDVFIGTKSIILKGVTIGKSSIVGAGSVVTKSIPAGEVWAGNPAGFIRKVID